MSGSLKDRKSINDIVATSFDITGYVARHFGFTSIETPTLTAADKKATTSKNATGDNLYATAAERLAVLRTYQEYELSRLSPPVLLHYNLPIKGAVRRKKPLHRYFNLDAIGSRKAIVDALLVQASISALREDGYKNLAVRLNSIGDKESMAQFERELGAHYRKHIEHLPATERQLFKEDLWNIARSQSRNCTDFLNTAPRSMNCLGESSRLHFKEVLEFMEALGVLYEIDPHLVGFGEGESETIFTVIDADSAEPLAFGCRYGELSRNLGLRKIIPAAGATLSYKPKKSNSKIFKDEHLGIPQVHFVQIGPEAKLQSLQIIDSLREAKIDVSHSLAKDKCAGQLSVAERLRIPFILILGQKEAIEGTVLLREIETRRQEIVQQDTLIIRLKELLKGTD